MVECNEFVAEIILVLPDEYPIAISIFIHPRQSRLRVGLPTVEPIHVVFRLIDLAQVPDVVVEAVAVDVVYLQRWKTTVVPSPDSPMIIQKFHFTLMPETPIKIVCTSVVFALHHLARLGVDELSAAGVVIIVPLDASRQCGQLAIR